MNRWRTLIAVLVSQLLLLLLALPAWGQSLCRRVTSAQELTDGRYVLMFSDGAAPAAFQPERGACLPACPRQVEGDAVVPPPDALWKLTFSQDAMWITLRTAAGLPLAPGENGTLTQGKWAWQLHGREGCFSLSARVGDQIFWLTRDSQSGSFGIQPGENPEGDACFFFYKEVPRTPSPAAPQVQKTAPALPQRDSLGKHWYLGQLHGHSSNSGKDDSPGAIYARVRSAGELDFYALTDYAPTLQEAALWQAGKDAAAVYAGEDFLPLWGYETFSLPEEQTGHIGVLGTDSLVDADPLCYAELAKLPGAVGQFNHPGTQYGNFRDFSGHSLEADAVMQLLEVGGRNGKLREEEYIRALDAGWHIGPTAGQEGCPGGTMVLAEELTEEKILSALKSRRVYATEDSDLYVDFSLSGHPMGSILRSRDLGQEPAVRLSLYDPTDSGNMEVAVITRGGLCGAAYRWEGEELTFSLSPGSDWYYLKITQPDGDTAITAPVWIDWREDVGIAGFYAVTQQPVQNREAELALELYNREDISLQVTQITLTGEDGLLWSSAEEIPVRSGETASIPITIRCPTREQTRLRVKAIALLGGQTRCYESSLTLSCREEAPFASLREVKQEPPGLEFRIRGRITACGLQEDMLMVQDGTGAIAVMPVDAEEFAVGDRVEVRGFSEKQGSLWFLHPVSVEKCADTGYSPQPEALTPGQVLPDSPMLGMLVSVESTCVSGSDGTLFLQCPGGSPIPLWTGQGEPLVLPENGERVWVTGILWQKEGQTGIYLHSVRKVEEAEEGSAQETAEEKPDKKSGRKQVPYREAENPDVGDPLPRWLIRLLMRKEELWNCTIR